MGFNVLALRITMRATEPILLEEYPGSALRGALFHALLRRFCANPTAESCGVCPLNATCPVAALVAPLRDESPRGRDVPRPFVLSSVVAVRSSLPIPAAAAQLSGDVAGKAQVKAPATTEGNVATGSVATGEEVGGSLAPPAPAHTPSAPTGGGERTYTPPAQRIEVGQEYAFDLSVIGKAMTLFPYVAMSMPTIELMGLGRRGPDGRRGRPQVLRIEAVNPFDATGEARETLYQRGQARVAAPTLAVTAAQVAARATALPGDRLTLRFLTPTRLIAEGQLVRRPDLRIILLRLAERLDALEAEYGAPMGVAPVSVAPTTSDDEPGAPAVVGAEAWRLRRQLIMQAMESVRLTRDETHWVDVLSYSGRQRRATPIGGFVGMATYAGPLPQELRELLVWGEVLHVGKNAVKGDGYYRIELEN